MKVSIHLDIELDDAFFQAEAVRRGVTPGTLAGQLATSLDGRALDACRWADGVATNGLRSSVSLNPTLLVEPKTTPAA